MKYVKKWRRYWLPFALGIFIAAPSAGLAESELSLDAPELTLSDGPVTVTLHAAGESWSQNAEAEISVDGELVQSVSLRSADGSLRPEIEVELPPMSAGQHEVVARVPTKARAQAQVRAIWGWLSLLPPFVAILLAIWLREVAVALASGVWLGATVVNDFNPLLGILRTADHYVVGALADEDHASIAVFSLALGGMIGVISRSGGAQGMAAWVAKRVKSRAGGALATWLMGLAIFFDDYSNSLLVGTTMRPITDRLKISREKLAFLVDATSAPVSSFAIISSWVGVEVGYIHQEYRALGIDVDPYVVFLQTIPYRFYPILMLVFGLLIVLLKRDMGPMLKAERRALHEGQVSRPGASPASDFEDASLRFEEKEGKPARAMFAVMPIAVVIATALLGMLYTGHGALTQERVVAQTTLDAAQSAWEDASLRSDLESVELETLELELEEAQSALLGLEVNARNIFGKANSLRALLWSALLGGIIAIFLSVLRKQLSIRQAMESWVAGVRSIALAVMILVLAWSLGSVCSDLSTAQFVIRGVGGFLPATLLPLVVFLIAAAVSFATGTSWGTMGILFPLVIPLAHEVSGHDPALVLSAVASILTGSVWGDHCSPISDTTIMSSMASSCDHIDHVRTQLPYALTVGVVSMVVGELGSALGLYPAWVGLLLGSVILFLIVRFGGKKVGESKNAPAGDAGASAS